MDVRPALCVAVVTGNARSLHCCCPGAPYPNKFLVGCLRAAQGLLSAGDDPHFHLADAGASQAFGQRIVRVTGCHDVIDDGDARVRQGRRGGERVMYVALALTERQLGLGKVGRMRLTAPSSMEYPGIDERNAGHKLAGRIRRKTGLAYAKNRWLVSCRYVDVNFPVSVALLTRRCGTSFKDPES